MGLHRPTEFVLWYGQEKQNYLDRRVNIDCSCASTGSKALVRFGTHGLVATAQTKLIQVFVSSMRTKRYPRIVWC